MREINALGNKTLRDKKLVGTTLIFCGKEFAGGKLIKESKIERKLNGRK